MKFESNAKAIIGKLNDASRKGITEACLLVQSQAKALTPVDTGGLRDSIDYKVEDSKGDAEGIVGTAIDYAEYVENGTIYQRAQPYLKPAFRENKSNIEKIIGDLIANGVGR